MWGRWLLVGLALAGAACSSTKLKDEGSGAVYGELGSNDVSILFPLPESGAVDALFGAELLPGAVLSHLPEVPTERLRVVSARIDPCFPSLVTAPSPDCRFQLRLVMQPLSDDGAGVRAESAAVHLFYDLPPGDFVELVRALVAARDEPWQGPLRAHPTLVEQGLDGPYAKAVRAALLAGIGEERLTRVTFSLTTAGSTSFGGVDLVLGKAQPLSIAGSSASEQSFTSAPSDDPLGFSAAIVAPKLAGALDDLSPLYDSASAAKLGEEALWPLYEKALRLENPELRSAANVDCVSCHTAGRARLWLERETDFASRSSALRFTSGFELGGAPSPAAAGSLRAFGWAGTEPVVSARAANESAAVASYLNQRLLR